MKPQLAQVEKDVHTEHCCLKHGCKYGWNAERRGECTVESREKPQSYMCEYCSDWLAENWDLINYMNEVFDMGRRTGRRDAESAT